MLYLLLEFEIYRTLTEASAPQELEEWVAGAGDAGFIYFSLGTTVMPSFMPEK